MSKTKAPGDIPEWAGAFQALTEKEKASLAAHVGRSIRTLYNWASGANRPSKQSAQQIGRAFKRMGGRACTTEKRG